MVGDGRCPRFLWTPGAAIGAGLGGRVDTQNIARPVCDGTHAGLAFSHYEWTLAVWESEHGMRVAQGRRRINAVWPARICFFCWR